MGNASQSTVNCGKCGSSVAYTVNPAAPVITKSRPSLQPTSRPCEQRRPGGGSTTSKKSKREVRHAKQSSDRSGAGSEKRRQGDSRRGRDGRDQQGSDLSGRVRKTRPVERRRHDRRRRVLDRLHDQS